MAALAAGAISYFIFSDGFHRSTLSFKDVERLLAARGASSFLGVIEHRSPEEYREVVEKLRDVAITATSPEAAALGAMDVMAEIRKRNAQHVWSAPQPSIIAYLDSQRATLEFFADDAPTCNGVIVLGPQALDLRQMEAANEVFADAATAAFTAIYDGRDHQISTPKPTPADYDAFFQGWLGAGATEEAISLIAEPDMTSPVLCRTFIDFFAYLTAATVPGIERVRTEMAFEIMRF